MLFQTSTIQSADANKRSRMSVGRSRLPLSRALRRVECTDGDLCRSWQSLHRVGTGKSCCTEAVLLRLEKAMTSDSEFVFRRLAVDDAGALCTFYNGLSERSKRLFAPLGARTSPEECRRIAEANLPDRDTRHDVVILHEDRLVGWAFLNYDKEKPRQAGFGIGIGDGYQSRGLGSRLMAAVMRRAEQRGLERVDLCVVRDNHVALHLYQKHGFACTGEFVGEKDGLPYYTMVKQIKPGSAKRSCSCCVVPIGDTGAEKAD